MFPQEIRSQLTHGSPIVLPWADLYMRSFEPKMLYSRTKASHTVTRTSGIRHLLLILKNSRHFLPSADVVPATNTADLFEVSAESVARSVSRVFDPTQSGITNRNFFVASNSPFTEILYLSNLQDPLKILPATMSYYRGWRDVLPLRMVELSDMPLTLEIINQQIIYRYAPDGFGVFALDPAALILKYESYRREFALPNEDEDTTMVRYLVDDVINPCLLPDSFALWTRNLYRNIFASNGPAYSYMDTYWPTEATQIVGAGYPDFLRQLEQVKTNLENKTIHADRVYWSLPVSPDNTPLAEWLSDLMRTTGLPRQYQYEWIEGLAYFGWLETIWIIARQSGKSSRYTNFIRLIWHDLNSWCNNHPWTVVKDPVIQKYIQTKVTGLLKVITDDIKNA